MSQSPPAEVRSRRVLDRLTRPPVLTVFAALEVTLLILLAASQIGNRLAPGEGGQRHPIGDFAAFFTGARLIHDGLGMDLYDFEVQKAVQASVLGREIDEWQPYLNPPGLALVLSSAVGLGYSDSFVLFAVGQCLLLLGGLLYLVAASPGLRSTRMSAATSVLLTLGFLPLALTMFGGQNTPISFALMAGLFAAIRLGHGTLAGVFLGLLTFKPQYALVLGVLLLARGEWRAVVVGSAVGVAHYLAGAWTSGPDWPLTYLTAMSGHRPLEMATNAPWHFSLPVVVGRAFPGGVGRLLATAGSVGTFGFCVVAGWRGRNDPDRFPTWFGLAIATALLVSPHLQYYEFGILALPVLLGIGSRPESREAPPIRSRLLLAVGYFAFPSWRLSDDLGINPLFLMLLAIWIWMAFLSWHGKER